MPYLRQWKDHEDMQKRLERLRGAMDRLAQGDLSVCVEEGPPGGLRELEASFNRLCASISSLIKEMERPGIFLNNLIDSSVDGIIASDMQGNILIFNKAAEKMLGYSQSEVIGHLHISKLYPEGMAKKVMKMLRSPEHGGVGKLEKIEAELIHRTGERIPVYISAAIIYEEGEEVASVGIFTDLRERKRLEEQLIRSEKLSSLGGLAAGIAHELNQPLTGIITFANILLQRYGHDDQAAKDIKLIEQQAQRCAKIIGRVLDFARKRPPEKVPHDLNKLLLNILSMIEKQAIFLNIRTVLQLEDNLPLVWVDPDQLEQVIMNLLINAADAMAHREGVLVLRTRRDSQFVELDVEDNGKGIREDDLVRIFDPFFTTKEGKKGMGLGLSVSYGIIKAHQGEIFVRSEPEKGTCFTIRLPLSPHGDQQKGG
jgi:PAS domain S-box-containing protein